MACRPAETLSAAVSQSPNLKEIGMVEENSGDLLDTASVVDCRRWICERRSPITAERASER